MCSGGTGIKSLCPSGRARAKQATAVQGRAFGMRKLACALCRGSLLPRPPNRHFLRTSAHFHHPHALWQFTWRRARPTRRRSLSPPRLAAARHCRFQRFLFPRILNKGGEHLVVARLAKAYGSGWIRIVFILCRVVEVAGYQKPGSLRNRKRLPEVINSLPRKAVVGYIEQNFVAPVGINGLDLHCLAAQMHMRHEIDQTNILLCRPAGRRLVVWRSRRNLEESVHNRLCDELSFRRLLGEEQADH